MVDQEMRSGCSPAREPGDGADSLMKDERVRLRIDMKTALSYCVAGVVSVAFFLCMDDYRWVWYYMVIPAIVLNLLIILLLVVSYFSLDAGQELSKIIFMLLWLPISFVLGFSANPAESGRTLGYFHSSSPLEEEDIASTHDSPVNQRLKQVMFFLLVADIRRVSYPPQSSLRMAWLTSFVGYNLVVDAAKMIHETTEAFLQSSPLSNKKTQFQITEGILVCLVMIVDYLLCGTVTDTFLRAMHMVITSEMLKVTVFHTLDALSFDILEGMEKDASGIVCAALETSVSLALIIWYLTLGRPSSPWTMLVIALVIYSNMYLAIHKAYATAWQNICRETEKLSVFRRATFRETMAYKDICAVCLGSMRNARITPCSHMFHGKCLRSSLRERKRCPMCNKNFDNILKGDLKDAA
ncbi:RING finger protein 145-like [Lingula anatina]|uniref:RING finger protein 145-like n=1 Tax=Lingula anatina TaxID=7574 RepID=A0A1S3IDR4_LINAN|nr:RING finger protein 145-like [Lingula anatina]|eukprot:XP_013395996.1 RING finger protein 145-like [Lingula anatina]